MDINNLKSNSKYNKKDKSEERKLPNAVVKGEIKTKSKTTGRKIVESMMKEDAHAIKEHVIKDVIDPSIREIIFNALKDGLEIALFGFGGRKRGDRGRGYTAYGSYYKSSDRTPERSKSKPVTVSRGRRGYYDLDEIEFEYKEDAENVLDALCAELEDYPNVSGEVLKHLLGRDDATFADRQYGWTDLSTARIERIRGGTYILTLPRAEVIE